MLQLAQAGSWLYLLQSSSMRLQVHKNGGTIHLVTGQTLWSLLKPDEEVSTIPRDFLGRAKVQFAYSADCMV